MVLVCGERREDPIRERGKECIAWRKLGGGSEAKSMLCCAHSNSSTRAFDSMGEEQQPEPCKIRRDLKCAEIPCSGTWHNGCEPFGVHILGLQVRKEKRGKSRRAVSCQPLTH